MALAAGLMAGYHSGKKAGYVPPPNYQQLTFRRGELYTARFAPDGQTVIYAAAWDGRPVEIFATRTDRPESRVFGLVGSDVASISKTGEMLVYVDRHIEEAFIRGGTLAQVSVSGGVAPREISTDVQWADWGPDGVSYALVRDVNARNQLEYPAGQGAVPDDRMDQPSRAFRRTGAASRSSITRSGATTAAPCVIVDRAGKKTDAGRRLRVGAGPGVVAGRREVWFTGTRTRRQSRDPRGDARGRPSASSRGSPRA